MKPIIERIADIESISLLKEESDAAVVMFHGYGASMHDLFPLWEMWDNGKLSWYFPNGVLPLDMGGYGGRAWFSIDMEALNRAIQTGQTRNLAISVPHEFESTISAQVNFLKEIQKRHKKIIIGGFSQGAMCASHLALHPELDIEKLVLLSGNLMAMDRFPVAGKGIPFYQSHGDQDQILPIVGAKALEEKLKSYGFQGNLTTFRGGHEIPMNIIQEIKVFLQS